MKVLVLYGSPKKEDHSVTMRHIDYLQAVFPEHEFEKVPVALKIRKIEQDTDYFNEIMNQVERADMILWAYPVYFYSVPGQIKKFIELVFERGKTSSFHNKYASAISTSAGVFDFPSHEYIHAISEDFGMKYFPGCSFKSVYFKDLMDKNVQRDFQSYFIRFASLAQNKTDLLKKYQPLKYQQREFTPAISALRNISPNKKKLLVLTDHVSNSNLEKMLHFSLQNCGFTVELININDIDFKCGCIGCVQCQFHGRCLIEDDVNEIFKDRVLQSDAVLFAMTMKDRHISSKWKLLFDRTLFIAKKNVYRNIHSAFIVSGPASMSKFVDEFIGIYSSSRCLHNVGYVSDEIGDSEEISRNLIALMNDLDYNTAENLKRPYMYYKRAYFLSMREMMYIYGFNSNTARYYSKNKLFDYPHKNFKYAFARVFLGFLFSFPLTRNHFRKKINLISSNQYKRVIDKAAAG